MSDKEVKIKITADVSDLLKKLETIRDSFDDLGDNVTSKGMDNLIDGLNKFNREAEEAEENMNDLSESARRVDNNNGFEDMADDISDLNRHTEEAVENFKDISKEVNDINTGNLEKTAESMKEMSDSGEKVKEVASDISKAFNEMEMPEFNWDEYYKGADSVRLEGQNGWFSRFSEEMAGGLVAGAVVGKTVADTFGDITTEIKDVIDALDKMDDNTAFEDKVKAFDNFAESIEKTRDEIVELYKEEKKLKEQINEVESSSDSSDIKQNIEDTKEQIKYMERLKEALDELNSAKFEGYSLDEIEAEIEDFTNLIEETEEAIKNFNPEEMDLNIIDDLVEDLQVFEEGLERFLDLRKRFIKEIEDGFDVDLSEGVGEWNAQDQGWLDELKKDLAEYNEELKNMDASSLEKVAEIQKKLVKVQEDLAKAREAYNKAMDKEQEYADEFDEQLGAYRELEDAVLDFIIDTEQNILVQKRLAEAFEQTSRAMKQMYDGDLEDGFFYGDFGEEITVSKWLEKAKKDAKEYIDSLDLIDYSTISRDLDALTRSLDDKIDKTKEFKETNKAMDYQTRQTVSALEEEARALKEYADNAAYAIKHNEEFAGTSREWQVVGNHKKLEDMLSPEKIREYNQAVNEYLQLMNETGGEINKRFLGDDGKFDVNKYIADFERFGKPINQLTASFKALKQQTLEYLKTVEEVDEAEVRAAQAEVKFAKDSAKRSKELEKEAEAIRDKVKANLEAAHAEREALSLAEQGRKSTRLNVEMSEELAEAVNKCIYYSEKLESIEKHLAEAREDSAKATERLAKAYDELTKAEDPFEKKADMVKRINEEAKALRELGASVESIKRVDIEDFDKELASKLDNLRKVFDKEDLPKTIEEFKENLKAAFEEFNNLEFGKGFDMLKDVGKGIFDKIPAGAKAATVAIGGVSAALYKLYDYGKQEFFTGLTSAVDKLQPVIDMLQNFGQEVVSAFEQITDTDLDLGSLMALGPEFEYQMQKVASIAGSTDKQLEELTKTAEHLGGTTQYTASQVGEAFEYMAMAGYDTEDMLDSIEGVLALSIASGTDLAKTTDIVTDYMTALGMEANSTNEFVDKLAATVTSSNTTVSKFGESMKQVASQAGMLGVSMTDLATAIGLQANAGVKGSKAGTALKNVLANLAAPTEEQAAALEKLGLTADEAGSYLKTTADGNVDLAATIKTIMKATEGMTKAQKTALIVTAMGKVAAPGILAILNQGAEAWDELSATIENSTANIQYWNECMVLAGKSGEEATAAIEKMKKVFEETESIALEAGISTDELSHAIAVLGDDGEVTADNVKGLIGVISEMNSVTKETEKIWRSLDKNNNDDVNVGFDYDATVAKLTADTQGLTQAEKEELQTRLRNVDTYEEAMKVAREYQAEIEKQRGAHIDLTDVIERNSFSAMTYADKLTYLRDNYKEIGKEAFEAKLQQLGLGDSIDEIREICEMSDEEFKQYTENLETVKGTAEQLAGAMDETTRAALLELASAIENAAIAAFNALEPVIKGVTEALNEFFDTWHNGTENVFTLEGLEEGLAGLAEKLEGYKDDIANAISGLFEGLDIFVNEGSLQSILDMATSIITGICDGIAQAKEDGTLDDTVSGIINKIATWIHDNSDQVKQAGLDILDAIKKGINENEDIIRQACEDIAEIMKAWAKESGAIKSAAGELADVFVDYAVDTITEKIENKGTEIIKAFGRIFTNVNPLELIPFIGNWFDTSDMMQEQKNNKNDFSLLELFGFNSDESKEDGKEIGKNIGDGVKEGIGEVSFASVVSTIATSVLGLFRTEFGIHSPSTVMRDEIGMYLAEGIAQGILDGAGKITEAIGTVVGSITEGAKGILGKIFGNKDEEEQVNTDLVNIDTEKITQNQEALRLLGETVTQINTKIAQLREAFLSIRNVCYNQMINCTNIIRNQAVSWYNIINNQVTNARNILTTQMLSMAAVTRTQMVNITSIVRNQMLNCSNIVKNQTSNMNTSFVTGLNKMLTSATTYMSKILTTVSSYVSKIQTEFNKLSGLGASTNTGTTGTVNNLAQRAQSTASTINRNSNSLTSPQNTLSTRQPTIPLSDVWTQLSSQIQNQNAMLNKASTANNSSKSGPLNVTLKMNDIEMGKAVVDSLNALAKHGGSVDLPI